MIGRSPLARLFRLVERRHRLVFLIFAVVVGASLALASRLRFDGDMLALLPQRDPVLNTYRETLELFGALEIFPVAVRIPEGVPIDLYTGFADRVAAELARVEQFESIEHRFGDPEELLRSFLPKALLYLEAPQREAVAARLSTSALAERAAEVRGLLETPQALGLKSLLRLDPAGLAPLLLDRLGAGRGAQGVDWASGYFLSRDHRLLLILAKPTRQPQDIEFDRQLLAAARAAVERAATGWPELAGEEAGAVPEVFFAGSYAIAVGDASLIRRDILVNVLTSVAGVLALFYLAYRRWMLLAFAFAPLASGLAVTFGFTQLSVGMLSSATAGVAALLVGLGIDYVIVLYGRYVESRRKGLDLASALDALAGSPARGVVSGAVTTTATFYAFLITDFRGLFQMGLLVGTGILFCLVAVLVLLPAMLAWNEAHHRRRESEPTLRLHAFGAEHLVRWAVRWPRAVLAGGLLACAVAAGFAWRLRFEDNVAALRPPGNPGIVAQEEIGRHFGSSFDALLVSIAGDSAEEVLERAAAVAAAARAATERGELGGFQSPSTLIPPRHQQEEALAWLAAARGGALAPARVRGDLERAFHAAGLRLEPFADGIELLGQALEQRRPIAVEDFTSSREGQQIVGRELRETPRGWRGLVKLYRPPGMAPRTIPAAAEAVAAMGGEEARLTGVHVIGRELRGRVRRDALLAAALGTLVVFLLVWFDLRRLREALFALLPLTVGLLWMIGAMGALGVAMNFMNIFVTTMVIGIGVDYGLHVLHRFREDRAVAGTLPEEGLCEIAKGVVLAALTTVAGFGSLYFSSFPGLRSMGLVAVLGTVATALVAITLVPAFLSWRAGGASAAPPRGESAADS